MDFGAVRDLARDINFVAHGMPVVVTPPAPDDTPVATRGIWLTFTADGVPDNTGFQRREARRLMAFKRSEVTLIPRGTRIAAPEHMGGTTRQWVVDGTEGIDSQTTTVIVLPYGPEELL